MTIDSMVKWSREWVAEFPRCGALIVCGVNLLVKKIRNNDCSAERRQCETLIRATRKSQIVVGIVLVLLLLNKLCCSSPAKCDSAVFTSSGHLTEAESKSFGEQEDFAQKGRDYWEAGNRYRELHEVIRKSAVARPIVGRVYELARNRSRAFVRFTGLRGVSIFRGDDELCGYFLNFAIISNRQYVDEDHPDEGFYLCLEPFEYETKGGVARVHCFRPLTPTELEQFRTGPTRAR